ncbi:phosphoenolpyruvate carboxykinase (ATP) [Citrus sinensis]|uniref:Phosphoenolpyruvate carboxykinase (ATP) n=1 Tax=Citrus sinensis TaxID=2711 RepID=A0ACB8MEU7_CITSI|nr:phosphoenolpyruvate carboxykinase (ATP) [Citrus sinensis]
MLSRKLKQLCFPGRAFSYGLNWALAGRGVVVNDKAFQNLTTSELQQKGATIAESLSGLPVYVRGNLLGGSSDISKAQYAKLLKQVTAHLSSIANVFVQDGAVGSSSECDAKVRVISDSPSALLKLSSILWKTPSRAVSHDSCPLTVYVTTSISPGVVNAVGLRAQGDNGFIAADIERSSLILCGKGFSDANGVKEALAALSGPVIIARGGLLLCARVLVSGDSVILLFAPEDTIQRCANLLVSADAGVIVSSHGVAPLFQTGDSGGPYTFKLPTVAILASCDGPRCFPHLHT